MVVVTLQISGSDVSAASLVRNQNTKKNSLHKLYKQSAFAEVCSPSAHPWDLRRGNISQAYSSECLYFTVPCPKKIARLLCVCNSPSHSTGEDGMIVWWVGWSLNLKVYVCVRLMCLWHYSALFRWDHWWAICDPRVMCEYVSMWVLSEISSRYCIAKSQSLWVIVLDKHCTVMFVLIDRTEICAHKTIHAYIQFRAYMYDFGLPTCDYILERISHPNCKITRAFAINLALSCHTRYDLRGQLLLLVYNTLISTSKLTRIPIFCVWIKCGFIVHSWISGNGLSRNATY